MYAIFIFVFLLTKADDELNCCCGCRCCYYYCCARALVSHTQIRSFTPFAFIDGSNRRMCIVGSTRIPKPYRQSRPTIEYLHSVSVRTSHTQSHTRHFILVCSSISHSAAPHIHSVEARSTLQLELVLVLLYGACDSLLAQCSLFIYIHILSTDQRVFALWLSSVAGKEY